MLLTLSHVATTSHQIIYIIFISYRLIYLFNINTLSIYQEWLAGQQRDSRVTKYINKNRRGQNVKKKIGHIII